MDPRDSINSAPGSDIIWYIILFFTSPIWLPIVAVIGIPAAIIYLLVPKLLGDE